MDPVVAKQHQVYLLATIWTETIFYGFYVCLFILGMHVLSKPGGAESARDRVSVASKVFFGTLLLMFGISTTHMITQVYRLIRAYGWIIGPDNTPISYFHKTAATSWDTTVHNVLLGMMIWSGDALVIYRCWIIWGRNFYIIIVPLLLAAATFSVQVALYLWWDLKYTDFLGIMPVVNAAWPLNFSQNVITTGLIAFKIIRQHRQSQASGLQVTNRVSLLHVVRIMVESASLYTLELLLLIILYFVNHPLQFVIQGMLIPSIGIVFILIAIRVHLARSGSHQNTMASSIIPPWLSDNDPVFRNGTTGGHGMVSTESDNSHSLQILGPRGAKNGVYVDQETSHHDSKVVAV